MRKVLAAILVVLVVAMSRLDAGTALPPVPATSTAPATRATDIPAANPYARGPGGGCANCPRTGSCWHRLLEWATYCPKERVGCCHPECNACHYKGALRPYVFLLNPHCVEGSGIHPTVPPIPCPSHKGCAHCRNCGGCTNGPPGTCAQGPPGTCAQGSPGTGK
jgi:hypothetical protein